MRRARLSDSESESWLPSPRRARFPSRDMPTPPPVACGGPGHAIIPVTLAMAGNLATHAARHAYAPPRLSESILHRSPAPPSPRLAGHAGTTVGEALAAGACQWAPQRAPPRGGEAAARASLVHPSRIVSCLWGAVDVDN